MKAEDTVIEGGVKQTLKINWSNTITGHLLGWQPTLEPNAQDKVDEFIRQIRLEQAEISFPLGEQEGWGKREELAIKSIIEARLNGIREVVGWGGIICMEHGMRKRRRCDKC